MNHTIFTSLGIDTRGAFLAPLAGVSDHPFRRICGRLGASLTYVEMISATALIYGNKRTLEMMTRHPDEPILGIQITGKTDRETADAVGILEKMPFDTIDINMGCPVKKIVNAGCGAAILKDPERVFNTVRMCLEQTSKPLSVKIRLGWDKQNVNALEIADAAEKAGASWLTVHGRTRACDYSVPVDLDMIRQLKKKLSIPVVGNGNLFSSYDAKFMRDKTKTDMVMVSRGALGNPWIFREIAQDIHEVRLEEWVETVFLHLKMQREAFGDQPRSAIPMRKHLLWYLKGWPEGRKMREEIQGAENIDDVEKYIEKFAEKLYHSGSSKRLGAAEAQEESAFHWDPKWDMNREWDRPADGISG